MQKKTGIETRRFGDFLDLFFEGRPKELESYLKSIKKEENKYFFLGEDAEKTKEDVSRSVFSAGIFLGEVKKGVFTPSLALIDKLSSFSGKKIFLGKKAEWLFLCGRDVFFDSIEKKGADSGHVFVQNMRDENLGIGVFEKKAVINLLDKGDYLRREK